MVCSSHTCTLKSVCARAMGIHRKDAPKTSSSRCSVRGETCTPTSHFLADCTDRAANSSGRSGQPGEQEAIQACLFAAHIWHSSCSSYCSSRCSTCCSGRCTCCTSSTGSTSCTRCTLCSRSLCSSRCKLYLYFIDCLSSDIVTDHEECHYVWS